MKFLNISILFVLVILISGCTTFEVRNLDSEPSIHSSIQAKTNLIVGIDTLKVSGKYNDAEKWQQGLDDVLRNEGVFKQVSHPYINKGNLDLIIRGKVGDEFRKHGARNFFTWWPGPLILAHHWRGTHYIYDATADIEVVDALSRNVLDRYHAESSYELIHKSASPGPFFAALFIVPGVIKGAMTVSPRGKYRQFLYEAVYPNLWQQISQQIVADQSKRFIARIEKQRELCGDNLDAEPQIGQLWSEFVACQTQKYKLLGQETRDSGTVSVYLSQDRSLRIHVDENERIARWFIPKKRVQRKYYQ